MRRKCLAGFALPALVVAFVLGIPQRGAADIVVPGADGSDGAFNPTDPNTVIDLSLAPTGTWNGTNQNPGHGVYDPDKWAVVFRYSSVNIPSNVTVTFKNHPARAPVMWLVSGSVTIAGSVILNGQDGHPNGQVGYVAEPGPGGFRGGRGWFYTTPGAGGFGPGGTRTLASSCGTCPAGASFGTPGAPADHPGAPAVPPTYGMAWLLPLIGGSGGAGGDRSACQTQTSAGGSAGGGAIVIAGAQTMTFNGQIRANGGTSDYFASTGSGGAIRLVADTMQGTAALYALGGTPFPGYVRGGKGRIRLEANHNTLNLTADPPPSADEPGPSAVIWPSDNVPAVRVLSVGGVPAPTDPHASFFYTLQDVSLSSVLPQTVVVEARNMPVNWNVLVRAVPKYGPDFSVLVTYVSGNETLSTWQADLTFPNGFSAIQVRASAP
jgi:hypothetical protein